MALRALLVVTVVLVITGALLLLEEDVNVSDLMVWPSLCTLLVVVVVVDVEEPPFVVHLVVVSLQLEVGRIHIRQICESTTLINIKGFVLFTFFYPKQSCIRSKSYRLETRSDTFYYMGY